MESGVYGDLIIIYLKPYSIYLRATISPKALLAKVAGLAIVFCGTLAE